MSRLVASCTLVVCFLEESSKITDRRFWFPAPRFIATCCFYFQQAIMSYFWSSRPIGNMLKNSRPPHNHCFYHFPPPQTKHSKEGDISDALEFETWFAQASTPSGPLPDVAIGSDALNIGKNDEKCIRGSILSVFCISCPFWHHGVNNSIASEEQFSSIFYKWEKDGVNISTLAQIEICFGGRSIPR